MNDLFDGLGTELIIFVLTAVIAGFGGYKLVSRRRLSQKAGKESTQVQSGRDTRIGD
ncbi:MAG: hypothetical protein ABI220_03540 [Candidatus Saccharimonadales bacterium]